MALDFPPSPSNGQVYDNFYYDSSMGTWRALTVATVPQIPAGVISQFAGANAPGGYLLCIGQSLATVDYPALFAAIGYTYGGSGASFTVPNLQNKVPVAKGSGTFATLGSTGGDESVILNSTQIPAHTHSGNTNGHSADHTHGFSGTTGGGGSHRHWVSSADYDDGNGTTTNMNQQYHGLWADAGTYSSDDRNKGTGRYTAYESGHTHSFSGTTGGASSNHTHSFTTDNGTGGGLAHNNLQPYIVLNYIIKT